MARSVRIAMGVVGGGVALVASWMTTTDTVDGGSGSARGATRGESAARARLEENERRGAVDVAHHFEGRADGSYASRVAGRRASVRLDRGGIAVRSAVGEVSLRTTSVRCDGRPGEVAEQVPPERTDANRVAYTRGGTLGLTEWLVDGPAGLEHGFDVSARCDTSIAIDVAVAGAEPAVEGQDVLLASSSAGRLRYADLEAFDADGRVVPAHFEPIEGGFRVVARTEGARMPVVIDPFLVVELDRVDPVAQAGANAGSEVALEGDRVAIGVAAEDVAGRVDQGAAYVTTYGPTGFDTPIHVTASDGAAGDNFGASIDLEGDLLVVGAPSRRAGASILVGAVYVYRFDGVGFTELQRLEDVAGEQYDEFGIAVAIDAGRIFVGSPRCDLDAAPFGDQGCVHLYLSDPGGYVFAQEIGSPSPQSDHQFGHSLAVQGDTLVVGAPTAGADPENRHGAAYVYVDSGAGFANVASLGATDPGNDDRFGESVAIDGDLIVVGAPLDDWDVFGAENDRGSAHVFGRQAGVWEANALTRLAPTVADNQTFFGDAVAVRGNLVVVGAPWMEGSSVVDAGVAFAFMRSGAATFGAPIPIEASDAAFRDLFGASVEIDGNLLAVGSPFRTGTETGQGSVYLMRVGLSLGDGCSANTDCTSGYCVDGVCCDTSCGAGEPGDCQACAAALGASADGVCTVRAAASVCRAESGPCDVAESCDGVSTACPSDAFATSGVCRVAATSCDVAESCDGSGPACPADDVATSTAICRAASGPCDADERCDGTTKVCPGDSMATAGVVCRAATGTCDVAELCDGIAPSCPTNAVLPGGTVCRALAGACDAAEACDGTSPTCPTDSVASSGTVCRGPLGACDAAEACDGTSIACPPDLVEPPGTICRPAATTCDVTDVCNGVAVACPVDAVLTDGTACDDALTCTATSQCQLGVCQAATTLDCSDGDACTTDACSEPTGCTHVPVTSCMTDAGVDAGADAGMDAGADSGAVGDASTTQDAGGADRADSGGCSCRVAEPARGGGSSTLLGLAIVAVGLVRARRRQPRRMRAPATSRR